MNSPVATDRSARRREEIAALPVIAYVAEHETGLWHAARLLGGYEMARLVDRLAEALRQDPRLTARVRLMLDQVLSLLTLEHVHDPNRAEMAHFVVLDPSDPAVDEICLLADGLRDAIDRCEAVRRDPASIESRAA
jgi:hypothetical protein